MDYTSDLWIGYLCENIIRQIVRLSEIKCSGCEDSMKSPLLHYHIQLGLLQKMQIYFEEVRGSVLPTIPSLYASFSHKLPHSDDADKDKEMYISNGRNFLMNITCEAMYYGRFITDFTDSYIDEGFKPTKAVKKNLRKRNMEKET